MTPQELRNSILQLAIQGKLVPQRPEDGSAADLLREIQEQRERENAAASSKRSRRTAMETPAPVSPEEIPFDIPETWKWVRLENTYKSLQYGYNAPAKGTGEMRMVRISDIQNGNIIWSSVPFCEIEKEEIPTYSLEKGDILFARTGGTVGKSHLVSEIPYPAVYAGYLIRTRYYPSIYTKFVKFFMESSFYWEQLRSGTIATAQPNCNGKTLSKMVIPLPPLAEQKRIVAKIEELMPLIDRYEKAWNARKALDKRFPEDLQKSLLQLAIQGKLVPQNPADGNAEDLFRQIQEQRNRENAAAPKRSRRASAGTPAPVSPDEIPFDIPETWKWVRIGDVFQHNTGKVLNGSNGEGELLPYITTSNLYWNRFDLSKLKSMPFKKNEIEKCTVKKGDLLVCEGGDFGRAAIWNSDESIRIQNHIHRLRSYFPICTKYFYYIFFLYKKTSFIAGKGIGIQGLSSNVLHKLLLPLPPLAEQKRIVAKLEEILSLCKKLSAHEN